MGENSAISWTDHTFNPWWGCVKVSPGCKNCYAADLAGRFGQGWTPTSERRFMTSAWAEPRKWNRRAAADGAPAFVFCASMADVFEAEPEHVREETAAARTRLWALIDETPWLVWLLLTKRPERVSQVAPSSWMVGGWPSNVWIGCTVEDQEHADARLPHLLDLPAPRRFVSYEPALGPVDWTRVNAFASPPWPKSLPGEAPTYLDTLRGEGLRPSTFGVSIKTSIDRRIDWLIVGGESGSKARPFEVQWAYSAVRQCREAGVPVWVKQLGYRASDPENGIAGAGLVVPDVAAGTVSLRLRHPAGADPSEWPEGLRVQERPDPEEVARG